MLSCSLYGVYGLDTACGKSVQPYGPYTLPHLRVWSGVIRSARLVGGSGAEQANRRCEARALLSRHARCLWKSMNDSLRSPKGN
jgi:hypothetical protein